MVAEFRAAYPEPSPAPAGALFVAVRGREVLQLGRTWMSRQRHFERRSLWYLGSLAERPVYAEFAGPDDPPPDGAQWSGLRGLLAEAPAGQFELLARACALWDFADNHRFCGHCGGATAAHTRELAFVCGQCGRLYYPRVAPCVMGLVVDGERVLLGHNARFAAGLYSTLAGFVEVGESAEAALAREVLEETGIAVDPTSCQLLASQAWPFPSQLMLGFAVRAQTTAIAVDGIEIVHAEWFHRQRLPAIPPPFTLSGQLIRRFAADEIRW